MAATFNIFTRGLTFCSGWCSNVAGITLTPKRSRRVYTIRKRSTQGFVHATFIDVHADGTLRFETVLAEALSLDTFGVVCAIEVILAQNVYVTLHAGHLWVWIGTESLRTPTAIAGRCVLTDGIITARFVEDGAFIDIDTTTERIAGIVGLAATDETSLCVRTLGICPARIVQAFV